MHFGLVGLLALGQDDADGQVLKEYLDYLQRKGCDPDADEVNMRDHKGLLKTDAEELLRVCTSTYLCA